MPPIGKPTDGSPSRLTPDPSHNGGSDRPADAHADAQTAADSYQGGSASRPAPVASSLHQSIAARPSPPIQPLRSSEIDSQLRALAAEIAARHSRQTNTSETSAILREALAHLRERFRPEAVKAGQRPAEKQILDSLRTGFRREKGHSPGKWNDEIEHLIKPFTAFIGADAAADAQRAEAMGLTGTKDSNGTRTRSASGKRPSSQPPVDPAWQARYDALPQVARDGRRFVRYNGSGMADFLESMHLPMGRRERLEFEQAFRDAAGITLAATGNWGMVRSKPSKTEPERIIAVWNALVAQAIAEDRLEAFLRSHRPATMTDTAWSAAIAARRDQDAQRDLALDHHPAEIADEDWKSFTEYHIGLGHPEDVTVEPRKKEALEAIVPAYRFLDEHVAGFGETIDIWDFLAAIYPVVRDILRAADAQGSIRLDIPAQILGDLDPRDWGYNTLAQRLIQQKLITAMNPATLYGHAHGDVGAPYYWNIRDRLVRPLAASSGASERSLNHFWSGILRVAPVLDRTAEITGHDGRQMTRPPETAPTRHAIRLVDDLTAYEGADHLPGRTRGRDDIKIRVTSGYYDALNKLSQDGISRLAHLASSSAAHGVRLSMVDGSELSLAGLQERHAALAARAARLARAVLDPASEPEVSAREIAAGLRELHAFSEEVIFLTQATGTVASGIGELPFVTATRAARQRIDAGHIATLYLDDLHDRAQRETWTPARIDDAVKLRVIAGHAVLRGLIEPVKTRDAAALEAAAAPFWISDAAALSQAAKDVAALEAAADPARLSGREPQVFANGERMQQEILEHGPVLPHRRLAPPWRAQWYEHAAQVPLTQDEADRALGAMQAYFEISRGFLIDFNRRVLRTKVEEAFVQGPAGIVDRAFAAITTFFPKVGVADGTAGITSTASELETRIAEEALDAYIAFFPQPRGLDAQVPVDDVVLRYFVDLCSAAHADVNRRRVFAMARAQLDIFNAGRSASPIATEDGMRRLPLTGILRQQFEIALHRWRQEPANAHLSFDRNRVWNAAFGLQRRVTDTVVPSPQEIAEALAQGSQTSIPGEGDAAFLAVFLEHQRATLRVWREATPAFAAYVRQHYDARYLSDASLAAFAQAYGVARVTSAVPIDPATLAEAAISNPYLPPREITQKSEGFLRTLLYRWMRDEADHLSEGGEELRNALGVAIETQPPPLTEQALIERGLALAHGTPTLAGAEAAEHQLAIFRTFLGEPTAMPRLREAAHALFTTPKAQAARASYLREMVATNRELQTTADKAADLERRSAEAYLTWSRVAATGTRKTETVIEILLRSIKGMSAAEADAFVHDSQQRLESLARLEKEMAAAAALPKEAAGLIEKLGSHKEGDASVETIEADLARAREMQQALNEVIEGTLDAAEAHRNGLQGVEGELAAIERAQAAMAESRTHVAAVETTLAAVDAQSRATTEHTDLSELVRSELHGHPGTTASFVSALPHAQGLARTALQLDADLASLGTTLRNQMTTAEALLLKLHNAGEGLQDPATEEKVLEAIDQLEKTIAALRAAFEGIAHLRAQIASATADRTQALDAAEKALPPAPAAGLPQPLAEEEISPEWNVVEKGASRSLIAEAHKQLSPVTEGRILSLPVRGGSRFISQYEARKVEAWIASGRIDILSIMDLFGNQIELSDGKRGITLHETRGLRGQHPFAIIAENISRLLNSHGSGMRLVVQLAKSTDKTLFSDLLRTLTQPFADDPREITAWIQTWALAHHKRIAGAIGETEAGRIFASPVAKNAEPTHHVYPPSYTPAEHAQRARWLEPVLADPRFGTLFRADGREDFSRVNTREIERQMAAAPAKAISIRGYDEIQGTWMTYEMHPKDFFLSSVIIDNPLQLMSVRAKALALNTPRYRNFSWLFQDAGSPLHQQLAGNLLAEVVLNLSTTSPWPLLDRAQEIAVAFHRALQATDDSVAQHRFVLQAVTSHPDVELAEAYPETECLLATAKIEALQRMQGNTLITFYPEFANALIIFEALEHYHLPGHAEVIDRLARAKGDINAVPTEEAREIVREEFRTFYRRHAAEIRQALQQEVESGVTLAMRLTGHPEPWKGVNNWNSYAPLDELRLKAPVVERVLANRVPDFLARIKPPSFEKLKAKAPFGTTDEHIAAEIEGVKHMHAVGLDLAARYPLINNAMVIIRVCHKHLSDDVAQRDAEVMLRISETEDEALRVQIFVTWATDPELLHELYAALQKKAVEFKRGDISLLEHLTGTRTPPWMPVVPPPPAEAAPAAAPATPAAQPASTPQIAPPEYTAEEQRTRAQRFAHQLAHPENASLVSADLSHVIFTALLPHEYRLYKDPAYRDLGWIAMQWSREPAQIRFMARLLEPIALTLPGREPPYTLAEAQDFARGVYRRTREEPTMAEHFERIFCEPDAKLTAAHPETAKASAFLLLHMWEKARLDTVEFGLKRSTIVRFLVRFPEFSSALAMMFSSGVFDTHPDFARELHTLMEEVSAISSSPERREVIQRRFRSFYSHHADAIRTALSQENSQGMTLARQLTGVDDPWNGPLTWDRLPPTKRLQMKSLLFARIRNVVATRTLETIRDDVSRFMKEEQTIYTVFVQIIRFATLHPELKPALAVLAAALNDLPEELMLVWTEFFNSILPLPMQEGVNVIYNEITVRDPGPEAVSAFVDKLTEPTMLRAIYEDMARPAKGIGLSKARYFTGVEEPWLPEVEEVTPAPASVESAPVKATDKKSGSGRGGMSGASSPAASSPAGAPPAPPAPSSKAAPTAYHQQQLRSPSPSPLPSRERVAVASPFEIPMPRQPADAIVEGGVDAGLAEAAAFEADGNGFLGMPGLGIMAGAPMPLMLPAMALRAGI